MNQKLSTVRNTFVVSIVGLVIASIALLGWFLYQANTLSFEDNVTGSELTALFSDNSDVAAYLEDQKAAEAHFVTIANTIKQEQQNDVAETLVYGLIGFGVAASIFGFFIARKLLKPVQEAFESQERFIQDAAHELRNPLAALSATVQAARSRKTQSAQFLTTVTRQTRRLVTMNEDLLFLEKRRIGKEITSVDISNLLYDLVEDMTPRATAARLKLDTHIEGALKTKLDPMDFVAIARNIIENAIKYSRPKSSRVVISLSANGKNIVFTVKDSGIGIPKSEQVHLGDRFFRAKNTDKVDGSGLGLAIVRKLTDLYGATMNITSRVNTGTTVEITFRKYT